MAEFIYVDNSNVFIEGKRVKAVKTGLALNIYDAFENGILDQNYRLDFGKLHAFVAGDDPSNIKRAILFGSRPPVADSIWSIARKAGFETVIEDRNVANREKKIDTGIVAKMTKHAYTEVDKQNDTLTLVAGDGDFVPVVEMLVNEGFCVEVVFWSHASKELKGICSKFTSLDDHIDHLSI